MAKSKGISKANATSHSANNVSWNPHQVMHGPGAGSSAKAIQAKAAVKGGKTCGTAKGC